MKILLKTTLISVILLGVACSSTEQNTPTPADLAQPAAATADELLARAQSSVGLAATQLRIQAAELMILENRFGAAKSISLDSSQTAALSSQYNIRYQLVLAAIAHSEGYSAAALDILNNPSIQLEGLSLQLTNSYYFQLGKSNGALEQYAEAIASFAQINDLSVNAAPNTADEPTAEAGVIKKTHATNAIWELLDQLDQASLSAMRENANSYELRGWLELVEVVRFDQFSIKAQLDAITRWRRVWARHGAATQLPESLANLQRVWDQRPRHIALILPLQEAAGIAIQEGFFSAYYQALSVSPEVPRLSVYDSSGASTIYPIYDEAVASGADLIIGPLNKQLVNQLQQLPELPVPTLALNYADDDQLQPGQLFQFGLAPEDEIAQAIDIAWNAGHRNAAIVTPRSDDYLRLQSVFSEQWQARGGTLVSESSFSGDSDYADVVKDLVAIDASEARRDRLLDILPRNNLEFIPRIRGDIDFIFLIANPRQGRQLKPTLAFYFAGNIPVYSMPSIYDGLRNQSENQDLDGIIFTDAPWVLQDTDPLKTEVADNLRQTQGPLQRLRAMGIDCFRLYPRLKQLAEHEIETLQGTTGVLRLQPSQRIKRTLDAAQFVDGVASELNLN